MLAVLGEIVRAACSKARGPTWRESARRLGSLVDGSGTDGAVRPEMAALAIERGRH